MLCALIMAGGIGSRFWPQSTPEKPKQFLKLFGNETMIQMTWKRINKLIPSDNIFIVTNERYKGAIKEQIPSIKDENIILEPCSRNTAPCILLSALYIKNLLGEVNIACVSSDSYIEKEDVFLDKIKMANNFLENNKKAIVTIGITPTRAETGYGYIKYEKDPKCPNKIVEFVEKPNAILAQKYLDSKEYLWNAGMFIFNNISMIDEIKNNLPDDYKLLKDLPNVSDKKYVSYLNENYEKCNKISIDYAVMEKSHNTYTIPSDIGWDDVGSWKALERYTKEDDNKNIIKGDVKVIDGNNNIIYGNGKKIILLNVDNLFCIDSDEVIIIGKKDEINNVHLLKDKID